MFGNYLKMILSQEDKFKNKFLSLKNFHNHKANVCHIAIMMISVGFQWEIEIIPLIDWLEREVFKKSMINNFFNCKRKWTKNGENLGK